MYHFYTVYDLISFTRCLYDSPQIRQASFDLNIFTKEKKDMFHPINLENWDRKEIYTAFDGYTYTLTAELDVTEFLQILKEKQRTATACISTKADPWIMSIFPSCRQ